MSVEVRSEWVELTATYPEDDAMSLQQRPAHRQAARPVGARRMVWVGEQANQRRHRASQARQHPQPGSELQAQLGRSDRQAGCRDDEHQGAERPYLIWVGPSQWMRRRNEAVQSCGQLLEQKGRAAEPRGVAAGVVANQLDAWCGACCLAESVKQYPEHGKRDGRQGWAIQVSMPLVQWYEGSEATGHGLDVPPQAPLSVQRIKAGETGFSAVAGLVKHQLVCETGQVTQIGGLSLNHHVPVLSMD